MKLSPAQVQRFWREWSTTCKVMNWTREAGLNAGQIDKHRKELLAACGFNSLTVVDRTAGFTKVLNELLVLQGVSLKAAHETIDPSLNESRILRNNILTGLIPCLKLYEPDVRSYLTTIIEAKSRYRTTDRPDRELTLMDLDAGMLKQTQFTLAARLNDKRKAAGESIHDMKIRAYVPCNCAKCAARAVILVPGLPAEKKSADVPF